MKTCPRCDKTYPDSETFCEADGTALVNAAPAFTISRTGESGASSGLGEGRRECPVCGGQAEPGEIICNFCGARLVDEPASEPVGGTPPMRPATPPPPSRPGPSIKMTSQMPMGEEEEEPRAGLLSILGYIVAASVALGGGAWLAMHLSSKQIAREAGKPSPAAASTALAPTGPVVVLAQNIPIKVRGESMSAPERNEDTARRIFDSNKNGFTETYMHAVASDSSLRDGMIVRLRVLPDGSVADASVRTSTSPHPDLDLKVVNDASTWRFPGFSGTQVEIDYPVIFARDAADKASIESDLSAKLASMSPTEAPEYATAPGPSPGAQASVAAAPESTPAAPAEAPPSIASLETPAAAPTAAPRPRRRPERREAARPAPTPSLLSRVEDSLRTNRKLSRVRAYTDHGTVVLFGKVFDDSDKRLAENTVRRLPGVTGVSNTITTDVSEWANSAARIQAQLQSAGLGKVSVRVIGHDAYLDGEVKTALERERAATIAENAAPVIVKANLIRVTPGNMFGF